MSGLRWQVSSSLAVVVTCLLLSTGSGALAEDQPAIDVTGHWASPLEATGIDLVQSGSNVQGSSLSGLHLTGTIDGRRVRFTYWEGSSHAKTHREDRGTGVMVVTKSGQRAKVTWRNDRKKAAEEGSFVIVRVGPPDSDGLTPTMDDGPAASPGPSPGGGLSLEEEVDALYDEVTTPSSTPAAAPDADRPTYPGSEGIESLDWSDTDDVFLHFFEDMLELMGDVFSGS